MPYKFDRPIFAGVFDFTLNEIPIGSFAEVSGLSVTVKTHSLEEGGVNGYTHQLPGRLEWPNIKLKRGVVRNDALFAWIHAVTTASNAGKKAKQFSGSISMLDSAGDRAGTWRFFGATPVSWTGPTFSSAQDDIAWEELEIAHEGFLPREPQ